MTTQDRKTNLQIIAHDQLGSVTGGTCYVEGYRLGRASGQSVARAALGSAPMECALRGASRMLSHD